MHMSDALVSPIVGGVLWAGAAVAAAASVKKLNKDDLFESKKVPLMGVMGAFVFAAQMINFAIPGTGASGHIAGGLMLAAMLGPQAGFLTITVILAIQSLFFADGGLLALGCNIVNMGFFSCFIAYPLLFRPLVRKGMTAGRITAASVIASIAGLQLGAFSAVLETLASGRAELPFGTFVLMMQPIHLAIGIAEGLITAAMLVFMRRVAPEAVMGMQTGHKAKTGMPKRAIVLIAALALVCGGALAWFASANPDGLEWSILKTAGTTELKSPDGIHQALGDVQAATAILPDYKAKPDSKSNGTTGNKEAAWPAVNAGTSAAGVIGGGITLAIAALIGLLLYLPKRRKKQAAA